jgi:hypothetical protein
MDRFQHPEHRHHPKTAFSVEETPRDVRELQDLVVETVLAPFLLAQKIKFGYIPSPSVYEHALGLFNDTIAHSELPQKLGISPARAIKTLDFDHCYHQALVMVLHDYLYKHFQQAIRLDPALMEARGNINQARTHLILVATRWYVGVIGDNMYVMDCLREVYAIFKQAQSEYISRQVRH